MGLFSFFKSRTEKQIDKISLYFVDGYLNHVIPENTQDFYDCDYIFSDGLQYDMSNPESIKAIPIPSFKMVDSFSEYGATGSLDYVIRMKAGKYFNSGNKELCSACLWKSTELMLENHFYVWRKKDYERLITWHFQLGMEDEAEKAKMYLVEKGVYISVSYNAKTHKNDSTKTFSTETKSQHLSTHDKELLLVQQTTTEDMKKLVNMPFVWNCEVKKFIKKGGHPFAYMDIVGENIEIVKLELSKINTLIIAEIKKFPQIPKNAIIPLDKLVFTETELYGCTRMMCTPKTLKGNPAKYPMSIFFMDKGDASYNSTHGEITYGQDGIIKKGKVYCWRNGMSYFYYLDTIDGQLKVKDLE